MPQSVRYKNSNPVGFDRVAVFVSYMAGACLLKHVSAMLPKTHS
ncbi:hypothetical protein IWT25_00431 [Secundilactobacillus pentosiphilus]|uniref:Uncharacterized protein n=1 Tax=Secundilactobacillus pentosiphilus TaxID=1714682 RepID=A0A1Z5IU36_9LACO|nr:hypothetical protein IWT25_00431 [Secundilactobacillus pentosiphilus]